jgi:hypothetical protein
VATCEQKFTTLVKKAFTPHKSLERIMSIKMSRSLHFLHKYQTGPLESALKESFGEEPLFGRSDPSKAATVRNKVAVIAATPTGNSGVIIANYNPENDLKVPLAGLRPTVFDRFSDPELEMNVWEALSLPNLRLS